MDSGSNLRAKAFLLLENSAKRKEEEDESKPS